MTVEKYKPWQSNSENKRKTCAILNTLRNALNLYWQNYFKFNNKTFYYNKISITTY